MPANPAIDSLMLGLHRFPVLSHERQLLLARQVQDWLAWQPQDGPCPPRIQRRGLRARNALLETNIRLVISNASRYRHIYQSNPDRLADLIQEGCLGLLRAIEKFDPTRGYAFSTYATPWIRQAIGRAVPHIADSIRLPEHIHNQHRKLSRLIATYEAEHGKRPEIAWLVDESGLTEQQVRHVIVCGSMKLVSLDQRVTGKDTEASTLSDLIADQHRSTPAEVLDATDRQQVAREILQALPPGPRDILQATVMDGLDHQSAGKIFGVSRSRIGQRRQDALELARRLAPQGYYDSNTTTQSTCTECGEPFWPDTSKQSICSSSCRVARRRANRAKQRQPIAA